MQGPEHAQEEILSFCQAEQVSVNIAEHELHTNLFLMHLIPMQGLATLMSTQKTTEKEFCRCNHIFIIINSQGMFNIGEQPYVYY